MTTLPADQQPSFVQDTEPLISSTSPSHTKIDNHPQIKKAYFLLTLLGVGQILPWNTFISAVTYFVVTFKDESIEFKLSFVYCFPILFVMCLWLRFHHIIKLTHQVAIAFATQCFTIFILLFAINFLNYHISFIFTLVSLFVLGIMQAILFSSLFAYVSIFPFICTQALMAGNGYAGLLAILLRVITKAVFPETVDGLKKSSILYFTITLVFQGICVPIFLYLSRMKFVKYYKTEHETRSAEEPEVQHDMEFNQEAFKLLETEPYSDTYSATIKSIWVHGLNAFLVFTISLSLFPSVATAIPSTSGLGDWFPIIMLACFMVGDLTGRSLPAYSILRIPSRFVFPLVISRVIFYPLLLFCVKPKYFVSDSIPIIVMLCMALSNGYLGSLSMMYGVESAPEIQKPKAGSLMPLFLNLGITAGLSIAFAFESYLS